MNYPAVVQHRHAIVRQPAAEILWRSWFEAGTSALNEVLQRKRESNCTSALCPPDQKSLRLLREARKWFTAANDQAQNLDEFLKLGQGQAALAWTQLHLLEIDAAATTASQAIEHLKNTDEESALYRRLQSWCNYSLGENAFRASRIDDGLRFLRRALKDFERTPENELLIIDAIERIGLLEAKRNNHEAADQYFTTAIRLLGRNEGPPLRIAVLLGNLCAAKLELGQYRVARRIFEQWLSLSPESIENNAEFSIQSRIFGYMLVLNGDYEPARRLFDIAATTALTPEEHAGALAQHRAFLYTHLGEYRNALEQLDKVKVRTSRGQRKLRDWVIHGEINLAFGEFSSAIQCFESAEQMIDGNTPANARDRLLAWVGKANVLIAKGYYKAGSGYVLNAIRYLEREKLVAQPEMALALHQLSRAYLRQDKRSEAAPLCERGLKVLAMAIRKGHPREADMLLTRAEIHWSQGQLDKAAERCNAAEQILLESRPKDLFARARIDTMRARIAHAMRDFQSARMWLQEAWQAWKDQEAVVNCEHPEKGYTILIAGSLFARLGDLDEADRAYELAEELFGKSKAGDLLRVAYELKWHGMVYFELGLYSEAKWLLEHALRHYRERFGTRHSDVIHLLDRIRATDAAMASDGGLQ